MIFLNKLKSTTMSDKKSELIKSSKMISKVQKPTIYNRYLTRPEFIGEKFTMPSMTEPGQDVSVPELIRKFTAVRQGTIELGKEIYSTENLDKLLRMDTISKREYIHELAIKNRKRNMQYSQEVHLFELEKKAQKERQQKENMRSEIMKELALEKDKNK